MGANGKNMKGENNPNYKTGLAADNATRKGIYNTWQNMKQRCLNPSNHKYPRYGGRGIRICPEWMEIEGFRTWAEIGWRPGLTIDRIDNNGNYGPENCRWVTTAENSRKKSTTKLDMAQAQQIRWLLSLGADEYKVAKEFGVTHGTVWFIKKNKVHMPEGERQK